MASRNISTGPITQFCTRGKGQHLEVAEHLPQLLVFDLGQRRIHHHDQADGNGDVGGAYLKSVDHALHAGNGIAEHDPGEHGEKDPQGEKPIKKTELFGVLVITDPLVQSVQGEIRTGSISAIYIYCINPPERMSQPPSRNEPRPDEHVIKI